MRQIPFFAWLKRHLNSLVVVVLFFSVGVLVAWLKPWQIWSEAEYLYVAPQQGGENYVTISWQDLLGEQDKTLLHSLRQQKNALVQSARQDPEAKMESQLAASVLTAQTWNALDGYQLNLEFNQTEVSIPGFIVPLDLDEGQVKSFFIVPYYGACLHYPPPPPNQIIYVRLSEFIPLPAMQKPYLFAGVLKEQLFEDQLATAAWGMEVTAIKAYADTADDARIH